MKIRQNIALHLPEFETYDSYFARRLRCLDSECDLVRFFFGTNSRDFKGIALKFKLEISRVGVVYLFVERSIGRGHREYPLRLGVSDLGADLFKAKSGIFSSRRHRGHFYHSSFDIELRLLQTGGFEMTVLFRRCPRLTQKGVG